jgi:hypothetical protein
MRPPAGKPAGLSSPNTAGNCTGNLNDRDAVTLSYAVSGVAGFPVTRRTPARSGPITARGWLAAAITARGQTLRPETFGHAANLQDNGQLINSSILMAVDAFAREFTSGDPKLDSKPVPTWLITKETVPSGDEWGRWSRTTRRSSNALWSK